MCNKPFIIGISGACGSGKTWFARRLQTELVGSVCIFTLDSYSKNEDFVNSLEFRYDNPQAIDYDKAYENLLKLLQGIPVALPMFDYTSHSINSEMTVVSPSVIIIEGIYAFYDNRLLDLMDFKIWIEAGKYTRRERRIERDVNERGEIYENAMYRHLHDSEPAFKKYYLNGKVYSDCVFFNAKKRGDNTINLIKLMNAYIYGKQ